jgi:hypothetical protein
MGRPPTFGVPWGSGGFAAASLIGGGLGGAPYQGEARPIKWPPPMSYNARRWSTSLPSSRHRS